MDRSDEILKAIEALDSKIEALDSKMGAGFERLDARIDALEASVNARFERLEIAVLDIGSRLLAGMEVAQVKAKMSSGGLSAPPPPAVPLAAKPR